MVKIAGKYQLEKNENYIEFIQTLGQNLSPDLLAKLNTTGSIFEVSIDGENVAFITHSASGNAPTTKFTIGKEFVEETLGGFKLNTVARKEGNKIILAASMGSKSGERIYEFSDGGLIVTYTSEGVVGKRIYKRL